MADEAPLTMTPTALVTAVREAVKPLDRRLAETNKRLDEVIDTVGRIETSLNGGNPNRS